MIAYGLLMIPAALLCVYIVGRILGAIFNIIGPRIDRWHDR